MRRFFGASVVVGLVLTAGPVLAHHSFAAEYDAKKPVTFASATITKVEWSNPHSGMHTDVTRPTRTVDKGLIEGNAPSSVARRGIARDALKVGTGISVTGYQALQNSWRASGRDATYPDGRRVLMASSGGGAPPE